MNTTPTFHLEENMPYYERASYTWSDDSIRYFNTVSAQTRNRHLYMQECGNFKTTYPYFTECSSLPSYLILYTLAGKGKLTYQHQTWSLTPGSCFYIDCMNPHRYETLQESGWDFLWLHFRGNQAGYCYEDFARCSPPVLMLGNSFPVESALRRILSVHRQKLPYAEVLTASLITNIITELMIRKITESDNLSKLSDPINDTISYIQSHYMETLTLDMLAGWVNISKYHLSREFTRHMGISINQYLINYRITCAKSLLMESQMSIDDIAFQVGIHNVSHFIQLFKEREGITPLKFRKLWQ